MLRGSDDANIAAVAAVLSRWPRLLGAPGAGPFERGLRAALHLPLACPASLITGCCPRDPALYLKLYWYLGAGGEL